MSENVEKTVAALEQAWAAALAANDKEILGSFMAESYFSVDLDGTIWRKDEALAYANSMSYTSARIEGLNVTPYGSAAVATAVYTVEGRSEDAPVYFRARYVALWSKMPDGRWQCAALVYSPLKQ